MSMQSLRFDGDICLVDKKGAPQLQPPRSPMAALVPLFFMAERVAEGKSACPILRAGLVCGDRS